MTPASLTRNPSKAVMNKEEMSTIGTLPVAKRPSLNSIPPVCNPTYEPRGNINYGQLFFYLILKLTDNRATALDGHAIERSIGAAVAFEDDVFKIGLEGE